MQSTIETPEVYQSSITLFKQHSNEDYKLVGELEAVERSRRIEDIQGEAIRKSNAQKTSEMFAFHTRPIWFLEGSSHFFELVSLAREAGSNMLNYSSTKAMQVTADLSDFMGKKGYQYSKSMRHNLNVAGEKGMSTAHELKSKASDKAFELTFAVSDRVGGAGLEAGNTISHKLDNEAHKASVKATEASHNAKVVAKEQMNNAGNIAHQTARMVRSVSSTLLGKFNRSISKLSYNTHMAFFSLQLEAERSRRLSDEMEVYAILNALTVSNLIKDLGREFYRPSSEPSRLFTTRLLEQYESSSRLTRDISGPATNNAKRIAKAIDDKFASRTVTITTGEFTIAPTPALVSAKSVYLGEIKRNVDKIEALSPMGASM